MDKQPCLSDVTGDYLYAFHDILETMIEGMTGAELTNSISHNFIVQMIPHHRAAIDMCRNLLQYTTYLPLQNIARDIITEQTQSIDDMLAALPACAALTNSEQALCRHQRQMDEILHTMFCRMENARADNRLNCDFMWEMIPHHMGAVAMSQTTLRCEICPALRPILRAIITSQQRGIRQMRHLQHCLRC